jgi:spore coat protein A
MVHGGRVPPESDGYPENWCTPGKSLTVHYHNEQDSALLWYHDHVMGINRLNVYAGLTGLCIVRDSHEEALHLPSGKYEVPLVLLDRMLTADAQLYYPVSIGPEAPWTPEVFGNMILANGKLLPFLEVEPRMYRLRMLNGSNARFLRLKLAKGQALHQIALDQGLLERPDTRHAVSGCPRATIERAGHPIHPSSHRTNP